MAGKRYPVLGSYHWRNKESRPRKVMRCRECEKEVQSTEPLFAIEIEVSWFRGEDEVVFLCEEHGKAFNSLPHDQKLPKAIKLNAAGVK